MDLALLERDYPISHRLLWHDELMTPVLNRYFGPVHAAQTGMKIDGDIVTRWSVLYQTATNTPLLQAVLVLNRPALPDGLLERLFAGTRPFGGLLIEAGIAVRMADRVIYRAGGATGAQAVTWGRRQKMLDARAGGPLCDVDECLVDETALRRAMVGAAP